MDKSGIYARDSLSSISLILSYIPEIPDFREYVTFDLIGGKNKSVMTWTVRESGYLELSFIAKGLYLFINLLDTVKADLKLASTAACLTF